MSGSFGHYLSGDKRPSQEFDTIRKIMNNIPESHRDLLRDECRAFVYLATRMADGSPQVTPVWFNTSGDYILINSAKGRLKDKNMRRNPMVALCIQDPANPYRYLQVRGKVVEITEEGADAHIDALAGKYTGDFKYRHHQPGVNRITYKILPEKVDAHG
jgi:PPOX class probable F420-dependent enzyme